VEELKMSLYDLLGFFFEDEFVMAPFGSLKLG